MRILSQSLNCRAGKFLLIVTGVCISLSVIAGSLFQTLSTNFLQFLFHTKLTAFITLSLFTLKIGSVTFGVSIKTHLEFRPSKIQPVQPD